MKRSLVGMVWLAAALAASALTTGAYAEDVDKKFRIGFSIGTFLPQDKIHSASANQRALFDNQNVFQDLISDPRNDSAANSDFGLRGQYAGTLSLSYSFTPIWYLEGSAGYRRGDVSNVEVQAQFDGTPATNLQDFQFKIFNIDAGSVQQIPLQISVGARFRPKAGFNPYILGGVGYVVNSFQTSDELSALSVNMDKSRGGFARLVGTAFTGESFQPPTSFTDLSGITVDMPNTTEWHLGAGFEATIKKHWAFFFDARYMTYSQKYQIQINGGKELGISVPSDRATIGTPGALGPFGAVLIENGGLVDGGSLVPSAGQPAGTDCVAEPNKCEFTGPKDGKPDPGFYYVHAGNVKLDGLSLFAGFKYTF